MSGKKREREVPFGLEHEDWDGEDVEDDKSDWERRIVSNALGCMQPDEPKFPIEASEITISDSPDHVIIPSQPHRGSQGGESATVWLSGSLRHQLSTGRPPGKPQTIILPSRLQPSLSPLYPPTLLELTVLFFLSL